MINYEINSQTMAIIPISKNVTKVIEEDGELIINKNTFEIIEHSCRYFGSTYEGRHIGTKEILGISYKTPILIEESQNIIIFPTTSSRQPMCSWICLNKINNCINDKYKTTIIFKNGYHLNLDISIGSLKNQIYRSTMLESIIRKRTKIS